ncbi:MAG: N-6 DNA methylase, partial [Candidatus Kapabacteria bacterium]|nr:N-6 DNA methylase [Candidatus Kapabacteria bacterium]
AFKRKTELYKVNETGTTDTRNSWMVPLLGILSYKIEKSNAEILNEKSYAISHRDINIDNFPIHIIGCNESLDRKPESGTLRMSPHSLVQEYINLTEHLYAIITNGYQLRILRDATRLVKLSYLEFNLEQMFDEEHFADFALMYRLIHATRMPKKIDQGAESIIENYHQEALASGSRIRNGLRNAVKDSIQLFANGFMNNPSNVKLKEKINNDNFESSLFYQIMLRLIYRLLFLIVIEERNLLFTPNTNKSKREAYTKYYSLRKLRILSEKRYAFDSKFNDLWIGLKLTFKLFEDEYFGLPFEIKPLNGDLFGYNALDIINECELDNHTLLTCIRNLSLFTNEKGDNQRVNYASLNVEEFGSVYEGLLEYSPQILKNEKLEFVFAKGDERSKTGSHYTPDELVKPLIKHSLEYLIEDKLREKDVVNALLSIKVCDVACGSGHILLSAARRLAHEVAKARTGEDQPSPEAYREAIRDVIRNCIYGVDKNPLAVELCKVSLWLEAHNPGEPLSFLDHKIKCGDSIVGLAHKEELEKGIADEAFKRMPNDDKDIASLYSKKNKDEKKTLAKGLVSFDFEKAFGNKLDKRAKEILDFINMPEHTPNEINAKKRKFEELNTNHDWWKLKNLADMQTAQFFIPKTEENKNYLLTEAEYRQYLNNEKPFDAVISAKAMALSQERRFFHWFLEFPEVFQNGGFDCILGNPPFLGGKKISGAFGN